MKNDSHKQTRDRRGLVPGPKIVRALSPQGSEWLRSAIGPQRTIQWTEEPCYPDVPVTYDLRRKCWLLLAPVKVQLPDGQWMTIPHGLEWDLASIPQRIWDAGFAPYQLSMLAPLVHDWLYMRDGVLEEDGLAYTRADADEFFRLFMIRQGVRKTKARVAWRMVRMFGWRWWNNSKPGRLKG